MTRIAWCIRTVCTRAPTDWPKDASERKRVSIDATCCEKFVTAGNALATIKTGHMADASTTSLLLAWMPLYNPAGPISPRPFAEGGRKKC
jgi:hypothetical protein